MNALVRRAMLLQPLPLPLPSSLVGGCCIFGRRSPFFLGRGAGISTPSRGIVEGGPTTAALALKATKKKLRPDQPRLRTLVTATRTRTAAATVASRWARAGISVRSSSSSSIGNGIDGSSSGSTAGSLPLSVREMDSSTLVTLAELGNHGALEEVLIRHIADVDSVSYGDARNVFEAVERKNQEYMYALALPYKLGIAAALTAGFVSFPMVFDASLVHWFNEHYVTADVPEPKDLETALEVGSWAWDWMEPPLGQISFFLLCLQHARNQVRNLGIRPYTARVKRWRAERVAAAFPTYDAGVVMAYSQSSPLFMMKRKNK